MMRTAFIDEDVHQKLETDFRPVLPGSLKSSEWLNDSTYRDEWGVVRTKPEGAYYYEQKEFPLAGEISKNDIMQYSLPDPDNPEVTRGLEEQIDELRAKTDAALVLKLPSMFIHKTQYLRGFSDWYIDFINNVELIELLIDKVFEVNLEMARKILLKVKDKVDIIMTSDDIGAQSGLQISPELFRKIIKPRFKRYFDLIQELSPGTSIQLHSCGSVVDILGDLVELGINIVNPVQVSAARMDPEYLKKEYGDKLCFWGAIDTQHVLPKESPEGVRKEVKRIIETLGKNGGYVLAAVHNIQPEVPAENVVTMFEYGKEFSQELYQ
jgi:uroporphyrinogen decarboxylase